VRRFGFEWPLSHALEIGGGDSELGRCFLVGGNLATLVGAARLDDVAGLFVADRLIVCERP